MAGMDRGVVWAFAAVFAGSVFLSTAPAAAQEQQQGENAAGVGGGFKSQYHLFNPTPRGAMRELSTDRPDVTESAYTVDAGHFQVELSFVEYTRDGGGFEEWAVLPSNLKVGLLNNVDLQLVLTPYVEQEVDDARDASGFGDTQLRLKVNLWGNDGGTTALAVMPYVQLPTGDDDLSSNDVEGGIIVPLAVGISDRWGVNFMAEVDLVRDAADEEYETEFLHTASVSYGVTDRVGSYAEYIGIASTEDDLDYRVLLGVGMTYGVSDNVQLDAGVNVGLTDEADDVRVFAGMSFRL